jgi:hypothetical protein
MRIADAFAGSPIEPDVRQTAVVSTAVVAPGSAAA